MINMRWYNDTIATVVQRVIRSSSRCRLNSRPASNKIDLSRSNKNMRRNIMYLSAEKSYDWYDGNDDAPAAPNYLQKRNLISIARHGMNIKHEPSINILIWAPSQKLLRQGYCQKSPVEQ